MTCDLFRCMPHIPCHQVPCAALCATQGLGCSVMPFALLPIFCGSLRCVLLKDPPAVPHSMCRVLFSSIWLFSARCSFEGPIIPHLPALCTLLLRGALAVPHSCLHKKQKQIWPHMSTWQPHTLGNLTRFRPYQCLCCLCPFFDVGHVFQPDL